MLTLIIIVVLLCIFFGGGWWGYRSYGSPYGWSPLALLVIALIVLWLLGYIHA